MSLPTPYYDRDNVTLHCGDNVATMQAVIPDASSDLVVTSPPYDNLRTYGGHSWDFEGVAQQLWRVIKPGGVVVWVVNDATVNGSETGTSFRQALRFMEIGFRLHDTMIYERAMAPLTHRRYEQEFEFMFVLSHGTPSRWNPLKTGYSEQWKDRMRYPSTSSMLRKQNGEKDHRTVHGLKPDGRIRGNVWRYSVGGLSEASKHPAAFPEQIANDHILSWSNEGDTVLDCFSGSGTTAKMARLMGRKAIGIEINPEYCQIAVSRLRQKVLDFTEVES